MDRERKVAIIVIVIAVCIPLAVLPFVSGYSKEKNIFQNLYQIGIPLNSEKQTDTVKPDSPGTPGKTAGSGFSFRKLMPPMIPFRFILASAILLLFTGILRLDRARKRQNEEAGPSREG